MQDRTVSVKIGSIECVEKRLNNISRSMLATIRICSIDESTNVKGDKIMSQFIDFLVYAKDAETAREKAHELMGEIQQRDIIIYVGEIR
jgi:hypothetical protein